VLRIFRHFLPVPTVSLAVLEFSMLTAALYLTLTEILRLGLAEPTLGASAFWIAAAVSATVVLGMVGLGLYSYGVLVDRRILLGKSVVALVIVLPLASALFIAMHKILGTRPDSPSASLAAVLLISILCLLFSRAAFSRLTESKALKRRLLVVGTGPGAVRLHQFLLPSRMARLEIVGFYDLQEQALSADPDAVVPTGRLRSTRASASLLQLAKEHGAGEVVVATEERRGLPIHELLSCKVNGVNVVDYLTFVERETRQIDLENLQPGWLVFSDGFRSGRFTDAVKRAFDIAVSMSILAITLPILVATAIAVRLEDGGPILYRQERVGRYGRSFMLYKFRSMGVDAEKDGQKWAAVRDPRVTRVGAVIRKLRIDELPQIICVLRGDMSFIGPRPERPYFVEQLASAIPFYAERHCVKPGISGWAQINYPYGASLEESRQKLAYDLYYVKNRSIFLDFLILIQTIRVIVWPEGAR
jgi:sugar transferase (PEP-CTERM system associated)